MPAWDDPQIFGKKAPVHVEYCSGNGAWIVEKALENPGIHWVAVEKKFDRVRKICSKMHNFSLDNLFIVCGEALTFTENYLKRESVESIFVNFPDPWPKEKHAKNRLLQEPFFQEMARICCKGGEMMIVTDHAKYAQEVLEGIASSSHWKSSLEPPFFSTEWEGYGTSYFDTLWREQGLQIHYMHFINQGS